MGGTSATLQSAVDDDGVALPAGRYFFALNGDSSNKEHISCDLSGTSLTNIKSLSRQGVEVAGVVRAARIGSTVTLTDFAHLKFINDLVAGTTSFPAGTPLGYDGTASITTANQFATKAYVDGVVIAGAADASTTVKGISKLSTAPVSGVNPIAVGDNDARVPTQGENDALVGTSGTPSSSNKYVTDADTTGTGAVVRASITTALTKFGGTGTDGALTITSGATNVDLGGASVYIKNYTSISITGTGSLTFSNVAATGTVIILKSQGNLTLTSSTAPMVNGSAVGAAGGIASTGGGVNANFPGGEGGAGSSVISDGTRGTASISVDNTATGTRGGSGNDGIGYGINKGGIGGLALSPAPGNAFVYGSGYENSSKSGLTFNPSLFAYNKSLPLIPGSGGGGGGGGNGAGASFAGAAGGRGGGAIYIECGGAWNFTTASGISVAGQAGTTGAGATGRSGSGGGGGVFIAIYNTLTANSGTVTVAGGASAGSAPGYAGATGLSMVFANTEFS